MNNPDIEKPWSKNRSIQFVLSSIFPEGVSELIFQFIKHIEFEDSRKDYMYDCTLFRAQKKIGDVVLECIPYSSDREFFLKKLYQHVDYGSPQRNLYNCFYNSLPRSDIIQDYESKYPILNLPNPHMGYLQERNDDPVIVKAWRNLFAIGTNVKPSTPLLSLKILSNLKKKTPLYYIYLTTEVGGGFLGYNNNYFTYPGRMCSLREEKYMKIEDVCKRLYDFLDWDSSIDTEYLPDILNDKKYEQSLKRKFKKNETYLFRKRSMNQKYKVRSRKYGIYSR